MSKPLDKQKARLSRRQSGYVADKTGSTRLPGSMSPHKTFPVVGRRTRAKVKADSRNATAR